MKLFSAHIEDLRTLYINSLKKALDMEQKITKALPDLIENSSDPELAQAFRNHLEETKGHVSKVRSLLLSNQGDDSTETCKVIDGLTTEASDTIKDVTDPSVRDIALIGAAAASRAPRDCRVRYIAALGRDHRPVVGCFHS
jgi:ferritin-like metal-binding protein YciE